MSALLVMVMLAIVWVVMQLHAQPSYGDSVEYWMWSRLRPVRVDGLRSVFYPLYMALPQLIFSEMWTRVVIYVGQLCLTWMVAWYFFQTLDRLTDQRINKKGAAILACILTTTPLLAHFGVSILTDSIAAAMFIAAVCAGMLVITKRSKRHDVVVLLLATVSVSLLRVDRLSQLQMLLLMSGVALFIFRRKVLYTLLVVLGVSIVGSVVGRSFQTADIGRPLPSLRFAFFDRMTAGYLSGELSSMPQPIQENVPPDLAARWDADRGLGPDSSELRKAVASQETESVLVGAGLTSFKKNSAAISADIGRDVISYMAAPVAYSAQTLTRDSDYSRLTRRTNQKLIEATPGASKLYIGYGLALHAALLLSFLVSRRVRGRLIASLSTALMILAVVGVVSVTHAFSSAIGFHIRYALPVYFLEIGYLLWCSVDLVHYRQENRL